MRRFIEGLTVILMLLAGLARAASIEVTPVLQERPVGENTAVYDLVNRGDRAVTMQVRLQAWRQSDGIRLLSDTTDLQVTPPLVTLEPGQSERVRVTLETERSGREQAYRVQFIQVPETAEAIQPGVRTLLKLDTPLFFQAESPKTELNWRVRHSLDGWQLVVRNAGTRFARLTDPVLEVGSDRRIAIEQGLLYILPGSSITWPLALTDAEAHRDLSLQFKTGGRVRFQPLEGR
ncbi:fimbrial biogenesis chaperone [Saccharospirillum salsuginis]|uniref:Pilus assembly protein n=1 Tax=Saccharospirillum salsuginis TaxID=418750 RepID=A0A918N5L6_9GAMM|nr:fimbria/pilus periplasmic chaperone [Saccharospirillum salsuginis]GGX39616.1 pilus assembly protein [Saccharospirillum salsuginis]